MVTLAEIGSIVDNIPTEKYSSKDLKIVVSEYLWDCIVNELKDYRANKDQINDDFTVNSFTFEGIKVSWCPSVKGTNIFYGDSLEEIKHRYNRFIEVTKNERKQK